MLRKLAGIAGIVACAAAAGMVGQSLAADAQVGAMSDKTIYAQTNPLFESHIISSHTATTLMRIIVHAPAAGTAEVRLDSQIWTDFPNTTINELENRLTMARCTRASTFAFRRCHGAETYWFHKAQNAGESDSTFAYSTFGLLNFSGAGTRTLYINGATNVYDAGLYGDSYAHVQVAFTPRHPISNTAHVTVSTAFGD
jgi:hypothetical protein